MRIRCKMTISLAHNQPSVQYILEANSSGWYLTQTEQKWQGAVT